MTQPPITKLTRRALYEEIWSISARHVAKKYGVPYVQLIRRARDAEIPIPPSGYWTKLSFGKSAEKPPLPGDGDAMVELFERAPSLPGRPARKKPAAPPPVSCGDGKLSGFSPAARSAVLAAAARALTESGGPPMNASIVAHRRAVTRWQSQQKKGRGRGRPKGGRIPLLADAVSGEMMPRVCGIFNALIRAMAPLGCGLTPDLAFDFGGQLVRLKAAEGRRRVCRPILHADSLPAQDTEKSGRGQLRTVRTELEFDGRLTLAVAGGPSFTDGEGDPVEKHLDELVVALCEAAEALRQDLLSREADEQRRRTEEERMDARCQQLRREAARARALTAEAADYDTACALRRYIAAVECARADDPETAAWAEWARAKADWYDPLVRREDPILGRREPDGGEDENGAAGA